MSSIKEITNINIPFKWLILLFNEEQKKDVKKYFKNIIIL